MAKLEIDNVDVEFGGLLALKAVSFILENTNVTGLIGPNGAGKSTLVNVISGFQKPTSGSVKLNDHRIDQSGPAEIARMGIARTFQAGRLYKGLTVRQNILSSAHATGKNAKQSTRILDEVVEKLDLGHLLTEQPAAGLPYTDQRRVSVARALAVSPAILCLDEPAAGMSDGEVVVFMEMIKRIPEAFSCSLLLIEHNMELVMGVCEEIIVLNTGQIIARDIPEKIQNDQTVIDAYLG